MSFDKVAMAELYLTYEQLLTPRQRELADNYLLNDLSLSETATNCLLSRSAVQVSIRRIGQQLEKWEKALGLNSLVKELSLLRDRLEEGTIKEQLSQLLKEE